MTVTEHSAYYDTELIAQAKLFEGVNILKLLVVIIGHHDTQTRQV
jgi:hypothetical protein